MRQTPQSILKSFQESNKKHLIITGERGCGKSTRLSVIRDLLDENMPGISTYAIPRDCVMLKESVTGEECKIGRYDESLITKSNAMVPVQDGFFYFGIPALNRIISCESDWAFVDEIGYLESSVLDYQEALIKLFDSKRVIAVVRKQSTAFIDKILSRDDVFVVELEKDVTKVGCVIMASGLGKRFGGNKLLAEFNGRLVIDNILEITTSELFEKRVVVTRSKEIAELCKERGVECVFHSLPGRNDTIRLGLEKMLDMDACMFCPSDQPMLKADSIKRLVLSFSGERDEIVRLKWKESIGMPVIFSAGYFEELSKLPEGKGGNVIIKANPERIKYADAESEWELFDVDTKEELELLKQQSD